jgi:outer membrane biogenesis lipoprotein LolB
MKIQYWFLVGVACALFLGCASSKETVTESTTDQTQKRVHTQEELKKSGETQLGPALEKTDPAIQTTHH